jgi:hypothetical protein
MVSKIKYIREYKIGCVVEQKKEIAPVDTMEENNRRERNSNFIIPHYQYLIPSSLCARFLSTAKYSIASNIATDSCTRNAKWRNNVASP